MIVAFLLTAVAYIFLTPLAAILPAYTFDVSGAASYVTGWANTLNAFVPVGVVFGAVALVAQVCVWLLPLAAVIWIWRTVKP